MPRGAREITLRFLAAPTDAGYSGTVGGGRVLEWIDKAGYAAAAGWSGTYSVTAYVGNVRFTRPVAGRRPRRGDRPRSSTRARRACTSSSPSRRATRKDGDLRPTTDCIMVFVAVDEHGKPTPVPAARPRGRARPRVAGERRHAHRRCGARSLLPWRPRPTATRAPRHASCCASSQRPPTSTGAARCTAASSCAGSTRPRTCSPREWTGSASNVAVYAGGVRFYRPLRIGHLVEVEARLLLTGTSSMHISVHVRSGDPATGELDLTTHSLIVFVPLDSDGTPPSPPGRGRRSATRTSPCAITPSSSSRCATRSTPSATSPEAARGRRGVRPPAATELRATFSGCASAGGSVAPSAVRAAAGDDPRDRAGAARGSGGRGRARAARQARRRRPESPVRAQPMSLATW